MRPVLLACLLVSPALSACDDAALDDRTRTIVSVLAKADESTIRDRPSLSADKYAVMASSRFEFYRGSFALFLRDAQEGTVLPARPPSVVDAFPLGIGDAHPENFGLLLASDGSFGLEPNDFDATDRYPFPWELRRLTIGMVVATRSSNADDPEALAAARAAERDVARAVAHGYATAFSALAHGDAPARVIDGEGVPNLDDLFQRAADSIATRPDLASLVVTDPSTGARRLVRGSVDPADPSKIFEELPRSVKDALPDVVAEYRSTLAVELPASYFRLLDAARSYGSGVASLPKIRIALLVEGPTDAAFDDVILELKELGESGARGWGRPSVTAEDPDARVRGGLRTLWSRPDAEALWGTSHLLGLSVQLKGEYDAEKGVKVKRMNGKRGTPEALVATGGALGALLARVEVQGSKPYPGTVEAIASALEKGPDAFADAEADVAIRYADVVEGDYVRFVHALAVVGPRLGVPVSSEDAPSPDVAALYAGPGGAR